MDKLPPIQRMTLRMAEPDLVKLNARTRYRTSIGVREFFVPVVNHTKGTSTSSNYARIYGRKVASFIAGYETAGNSKIREDLVDVVSSSLNLPRRDWRDDGALISKLECKDFQMTVDRAAYSLQVYDKQASKKIARASAADRPKWKAIR